jgi:hypothetical protein
MADFLKDLLRQGKLPESAFAKISRDNAIALLGL